MRVQFQRKGVGATRVGKEVIPVTAAQSCICAVGAEVDFGGDFEQVAWRVPLDALERKLAALTGRPVTRRLEFDYALDRTTPHVQTLLQIVEATLGAIDAGLPNAEKLILPELESALFVSRLCTARHNYRGLLDQACPGAAPWQVHRAERYIEANWDKPITLEDIVSATGASARSVFRAFRESRGYTPGQFMKQRRLREAKRLLESADPALSVTDIALTCGFADLSRFSKDFSRAFGEPPSTLRNRKRSTRLPNH